MPSESTRLHTLRLADVAVMEVALAVDGKGPCVVRSPTVSQRALSVWCSTAAEGPWPKSLLANSATS